jgi:hypothetical protein
MGESIHISYRREHSLRPGDLKEPATILTYEIRDSRRDFGARCLAMRPELVLR